MCTTAFVTLPRSWQTNLSVVLTTTVGASAAAGLVAVLCARHCVRTLRSAHIAPAGGSGAALGTPRPSFLRGVVLPLMVVLATTMLLPLHVGASNGCLKAYGVSLWSHAINLDRFDHCAAGACYEPSLHR